MPAAVRCATRKQGLLSLVKLSESRQSVYQIILVVISPGLLLDHAQTRSWDGKVRQQILNFPFADHPPGMSMAAPYTAAGAAVRHSPHGRQLKVLYYESMTDEIGSGFYDEFAAYYHLMFEDWEASMARQAAAISSLLGHESGSRQGVNVLDCACGIGTQSLGLAKLGYQVTGSDLSAGAIRRARVEASVRGLSVPFYVADVRHLDELPLGRFNVLISIGARSRILSGLTQATNRLPGMGLGRRAAIYVPSLYNSRNAFRVE
jgi:hypothetical protein